MKIIKLTKGYETIVDDEDYEKLNQFKWHITKGYAERDIRIQGKRSKIKMHREVMEILDKNISVDHINGNKLDNRKSNLRFCTQAQNTKNQTKKKTNTSGYKGVSLHHSGNWRARIMVDYKEIYIGNYKTKTEAAKAYNEAAIEYFGEFAKLNEV